VETPEKLKCPWWLKKRWAVALALWLLVAYPLAGGPVFYGAHRGWWAYDAPERAGYYSFTSLLGRNRVGYAYAEYLQWWREQAVKGDPGERWIRRAHVRHDVFDDKATVYPW